jgi:hypothetical protein
MNPYNWRQHQPVVEIVRPVLHEVADGLLKGGSGVLLAGRGMGKSVFLRRLQADLGEHEGVRTVLFPVPPAGRSVDGWLRALAKRLDSPVEAPLDPHEVVAARLAGDDAPRRIVLLFDEFDRYAGTPASLGAAEHPGRDFFNSLEAMRRDFGEVGIFAAGGIGVFVFRDVLGSSFLARADKVRLAPFGRQEIVRLARPFADAGRELDGDVLDALELLTGGNPALVTYGLQGLWEAREPTVRDVADIFTRFEQRQAEFLRDFRLSFASDSLSEAPGRVWRLVQDGDGEVTQEDLAKACGTGNGVLRLDGADVLDLLESSGLVRITGSVRANPVRARPVASLLSLPAASTSAPEPDVATRLAADLDVLLARLHAASADFFRPGRHGEGKRLVPEAVFSAYLALGFDLLGWQAEREAQRGAGRTDLLLRWNGSHELAILEVKIWGRNDYRDVQRQVESYRTSGVGAAAVVMLSDSAPEDWPAVYRDRCLFDRESQAHRVSSSPVEARIRCRSVSAGIEVGVDHFLLRLAARAAG